jgi:hypothetical protein
MAVTHPNLAAGRWLTFSLATQLGNVGSEYERALQWKQSHDYERFESAFGRMLELLDLTIADARWRNHRLKELTRLREVLCDELYNEVSEFNYTSDLRQYFLYFGILARHERDRMVEAVGVS